MVDPQFAGPKAVYLVPIYGVTCQFKAGEQRTIRNILSDPVTLDEAREIFGSSFEWSEEPV